MSGRNRAVNSQLSTTIPHFSAAAAAQKQKRGVDFHTCGAPRVRLGKWTWRESGCEFIGAWQTVLENLYPHLIERVAVSMRSATTPRWVLEAIRWGREFVWVQEGMREVSGGQKKNRVEVGNIPFQ